MREDEIASHPRQRYGYIDRGKTLGQYHRKAFEVHAISLDASQRLAFPSRTGV